MYSTTLSNNIEMKIEKKATKAIAWFYQNGEAIKTEHGNPVKADVRVTRANQFVAVMAGVVTDEMVAIVSEYQNDYGKSKVLLTDEQNAEIQAYLSSPEVDEEPAVQPTPEEKPVAQTETRWVALTNPEDYDDADDAPQVQIKVEITEASKVEPKQEKATSQGAKATFQMFKSLDTQYLSVFDIVDLDALEVNDLPQTDEEINEVIELTIDYSNEHAEVELQEKLEGATCPRFGFTTTQVFENEDEYETFLREVLAKEAEDLRQTCFDLVKEAVANRQVDEILSQVMTTKEISEEFGITQQAVQFAVDHGNLHHRRSGATILVLRKHAEARWKK